MKSAGETDFIFLMKQAITFKF